MTENPRQNVTFDSAGQQAHGYLAVPASGTGLGLIVIQEWWGLDDHLASIVDRFASEGFVALAPDLYGAKATHDSDEAGKLMSELSVEDAVDKLAGAVDYLLGLDSVTSETVGAVGFCMGGGFVLQLAARQGDRVSAAVPFYGVGPAVPESYAGITAAIQGHYGEKDDFYPVEGAQQQEEQIRYESNAEVTFFYYPAGHAFLNDKDLLGTYDADLAALAWSRAVAFLKQKVH
ncbi:MAG: carboxymethylenebutenolidase [Pseudonocardiales bacterium]|nr:carboxymethylenebutenolidase [Pseudonocardiales bacterium]